MKSKKASIALISVASALSLVTLLLFLLFESNYFTDFTRVVSLFQGLIDFNNFTIYSVALLVYALAYVLFGLAAFLTLIILGAKKHRYIDILFAFLICMVCLISAAETSLLIHSIIALSPNLEIFFIEVIIISVCEICFILSIVSFALEVKILISINLSNESKTLLEEEKESSNEENITDNNSLASNEAVSENKVSLADLTIRQNSVKIQEENNANDSEQKVVEESQVVDSNNESNAEVVSENIQEDTSMKKATSRNRTDKRPVSTIESKAQVASKYNTRSKPRKKVAPKLPSGAVKAYHISQRADLHKWQVKASGAEKAIKLFSTQQEAIQYANTMAANQGISIRVHGRDGKIRSI